MDNTILAKKIIQITRHGYYEEQVEKIAQLLNSITSASNGAKPIVSGSLPLTEDDIRFRCTRFAHECRLKGVVTNNDTVELYDKMFGGNDR